MLGAGEELEELTATQVDFVLGTPTLAAGNVLDASRLVQACAQLLDAPCIVHKGMGLPTIMIEPPVFPACVTAYDMAQTGVIQLALLDAADHIAQVLFPP